MIEERITVGTPNGLQARNTAMLVRVTNRFASKVHFENDGTIANGRSIMDLMMLAAGCGTELTVTIEGSDEAGL